MKTMMKAMSFGVFALVLTGWADVNRNGTKDSAPGSTGAEVIWTRSLLRRGERFAAWPTAIRTAKGEILVVFSGGREGHVCPYGKVQLIRSRDGGEKWSDPETVCNSRIDDRDAGIIELKNGDLVLFWFTSLAFYEYKDVLARNPKYGEVYRSIPDEIKHAELGSWSRRSTDGGKTWSAPVRVPVMTPHGGVLLKDGRIMVVGIHDGQVDGRFKGEPGFASRSYGVAVSEDDGRSFRNLSDIPLGSVLPHWSLGEQTVFEASDGTLTALFRYELPPDGPLVDGKPFDGNTHNESTYPRYMLKSVSSDGGRTWSPLERTNVDGFPPHVLRLGDGRLLLTYASRTTGKRGIYAVLSADDGKTWDVGNELRLMATKAEDIGYPSTVENPDGTFVTVFYAKPPEGGKATVMGTKWTLGRRCP